MPRVCFFTGKKTKSGQNRSHSERKTKRQFKPNLLTKWVNMGNGMRMKIKVSAKAYKKMRGFL